MTKFQDPFSEEVWKSTYKNYKDNTVDDTFRRVAHFVASAEKTKEQREQWEEKFFEMLSDFKVTTGGRVYSNAGTEWKGTTMINCFVGPHPKEDFDSLEGIYKVLLDQALTLKSEGGWGFNFSWMRPRGTFIKGIGVDSPGAVKFMELFDKSSEIVTSGSGLNSSTGKAKGKIRKGAMMGVMDVWHPDVLEFISAKQQPGRLTKFNISVNCTDEFMEKVLQVQKLKAEKASKKDIESITWDLVFPDTTHPNYKKEWFGDIKDWKSKGYPLNVYRTVSVDWLWNNIMDSTYNRAEPGILFLDRANKINPLNYSETIYATNPCVTDDTWVMTNNGPRKVEQLIGTPFVALIDGQEYPSTNRGFFLTGKKDVYELSTKRGLKLKATSNHLIQRVLKCGRDRIKQTEWVELGSLKSGDRINTHQHMNISWNGQNTYGDGYLMGLLVGDGYIGKKRSTLSVWINKKKNINAGSDTIMEYVSSILNKPWSKIKKRDEYRLIDKRVHALACDLDLTKAGKQITDKIHTSSSDFYCGFLSGIFDADGSVQGSPHGGLSVRLSQSDLLLLENIKMMLMRLGINSTIYKNRFSGGYKSMPDGKGGYKKYYCKPQHELLIKKKNLQTFANLINFKESVKNEKLQKYLEQYSRGLYHELFIDTVDSITHAGFENVYDVQIPNINAFDANGLYVHNCGEQTLSPGNICNLLSLNLTQMIKEDLSGFDLEKVKVYAKYMVRFADNINDISTNPLPEYTTSMREKRRIGCGILGWGSSLYMLKVKFGSEQASQIRDELMKVFTHSAIEESINLAEEKGMFKFCDPIKHSESEYFKQIQLPKKLLERISKVGIRNSSLFSIQPTGNCVTSDAVIKIDNEFVSIESLISTVTDIENLHEGDTVRLDKNIEIATFEGVASFNEIYVNGTQPVLEIKLEDGTALKQTHNHKYLVKIDDETADWIEAKNIKKGMKIIQSTK